MGRCSFGVITSCVYQRGSAPGRHEAPFPFLPKQCLVTWLYHSCETLVQGAASDPAFCPSRKFKANQATVIRADFKTCKILKQVRKEREGQSQKKSFLGESRYKLKAGVAALRGGREGPDSAVVASRKVYNTGRQGA